MSHVKDEQLYALVWALRQHHQGDAPIPELELDDETRRLIEHLRPERFQQPPAPEHELRPGQVRGLLEHARGCDACQMLVYETGPSAKRALSVSELEAARAHEEEEQRALKRKFFYSLGYALPAFLGANAALRKYYRDREKPKTGESVIQMPPHQAFHIHPMMMAFMALLIVAAWGLAECWRIANVLWFDWLKFKAAVPVVGKRWAQRHRASPAREQAERGGQAPTSRTPE